MFAITKNLCAFVTDYRCVLVIINPGDTDNVTDGGGSFLGDARQWDSVELGNPPGSEPDRPMFLFTYSSVAFNLIE